ncbi:hypothetical protein AX17_001875 [Amanita inopinata Kibby_2008]|nr:hypothetical protein AX17_001875 [Amanita inopinata Kibby_2008]
MKRYYLTWASASMNAWVWSSIFHTRDLPITEKLDYFSAALAILYALYCATIRLFHLYAPSGSRQSAASSQANERVAKKTLTLTCILLYIGHVSYLTLPLRFDYTYNMIFNVALGLAHNGLWLVYALPSSMSVMRRFPSRPKSYRPRFVTKAAYLVGITMIATALELFDFPPWKRVVDAHALWHLATAPIALCWYRFLLDDALDPSWRDQRL